MAYFKITGPGRYRARSGEVFEIIPAPPDDPGRFAFPWRDAIGDAMFTEDGHQLLGYETENDLVEKLSD